MVQRYSSTSFLFGKPFTSGVKVLCVVSSGELNFEKESGRILGREIVNIKKTGRIIECGKRKGQNKTTIKLVYPDRPSLLFFRSFMKFCLSVIKYVKTVHGPRQRRKEEAPHREHREVNVYPMDQQSS